MAGTAAIFFVESFNEVHKPSYVYGQELSPAVLAVTAPFSNDLDMV